MSKGKLYLIPCGLGGENERVIIPEQTKAIAGELDEFIVERDKTARHFLKRIDYPKPLNDLILHTLNKHSSREEVSTFLNACAQGKSVGIISEAGCPAVADPGAVVVAQAHELGIEVIPLIGPSSILLALMASGMSGQSFVFHGYIPKERFARVKFIKQMEHDGRAKRQTQIFMETPFRNNPLRDELLNTLNPKTKLCIACNIATPGQRINTKSVYEWKQHVPDLHKKPTVFVIM